MGTLNTAEADWKFVAKHPIILQISGWKTKTSACWKKTQRRNWYLNQVSGPVGAEMFQSGSKCWTDWMTNFSICKAASKLTKLPSVVSFSCLTFRHNTLRPHPDFPPRCKWNTHSFMALNVVTGPDSPGSGRESGCDKHHLWSKTKKKPFSVTQDETSEAENIRPELCGKHDAASTESRAALWKQCVLKKITSQRCEYDQNIKPVITRWANTARSTAVTSNKTCILDGVI